MYPELENNLILTKPTKNYRISDIESIEKEKIDFLDYIRSDKNGGFKIKQYTKSLLTPQSYEMASEKKMDLSF